MGYGEVLRSGARVSLLYMASPHGNLADPDYEPTDEELRELTEEWEAEIARRAERVRSGQSQGKPADEVFDRLESKLKAR